ncbi:N-glycosylase/DNA lyase [Candidatus Micrarchaeota archaeon]|nr:N-glycosylase/DNA lyase [Candidatus Micrarchaeota archaeon]
MQKLLERIGKTRKSRTGRVIAKRMREFTALGKKPSNDLFKELCFCILTANYSAEGGIKIQDEIGSCFAALPEKNLAKKLKALGHRFPNTRAKYISEARYCRNTLKETLKSFKNGKEAREWLVKNVKGLGYKEASHLLRNIGYNDVAIIDFHIIDLLAKNSLIAKPKTKSLSRKRYLEIEKTLAKIAGKSHLSLGELDLYLWYMETGKVLK